VKLFKKKAEFTIMKPTDTDIDACVEMLSSAMGQQAVNKKLLEQTLKAPGIIVLVGKLKERITGMITGLTFPFTTQGSPKGRIDFISVPDRESANKGLYSMLIDEFIEELKKKIPNAKYVETNVPTVNSSFVAMYSLKGFTVIGMIKGEDPRTDIVVLRKSILKKNPSSYTV